MNLGQKMRALTVAGIAAWAILGMTAQSQAVTVSGGFLVDNVIASAEAVVGQDGVSTILSPGGAFTTNIQGDILSPGPNSGSVAFAFIATADLGAVETNTFLPSTGFEGATVAWATNNDGTGIISELTNAEVLGGAALAVTFLANQTLYLIASWDDVTAGASDFTLRVEAVPVPPAALLFGSALVGIGFLSRRRRKKRANMTAV